MSRIEDAIARGRAYLLRQQDPDGLWHDSEFHTGEGSELVTAYVATAVRVLTAVPSEDSARLSDAFGRACQALAGRQRRNGGWAYSATAPTDAEATSWALWCLLEEGRRRPFSFGRGRRYLLEHADEASGGFRPYVAAVDAGYPSRPSFTVPPGLLEPQPCVTAVAVRPLLAGSGNARRHAEAACQYLKASQGEDGLWRSALWAVAGPPTLLALGGIHAAVLLDAETLQRARNGLQGLLKHEDAFELACALITAPRLGIVDVDSAVDRLLSVQDDDGSWAASSPVRATLPGRSAPAPTQDATGPARPTTEHPYRGRLMATATALTGLYFQS